RPRGHVLPAVSTASMTLFGRRGQRQAPAMRPFTVGTARTASDRAGLHGPVRPHPSARGRTVLNVRRLAEQVRLGAPTRGRLFPRSIEVLEDKVVRPAEAKFNELLARRTKLLRVENV